MVSLIRTQVADHLKLAPDDLSVSKFFHASDKPSAKVLFLVTDGKKPIAMVKIKRDAAYDADLRREVEGQRFARETLQNYLVPEVLFTTTINGHFMVAEEVLPGTPVGRVAAPKYIDAIYRFQEVQPKQEQLDVADIVTSIKALTIEDEQLTGNVQALEALGGKLHRSWSHGDLTFMNIMDINGKIAIIDWDRYNERPVWGIDFVHYFIRAVNVKGQASFAAALQDHLQLSDDEQAYFNRVYLLDEILDRILKNVPDKLKMVHLG